MPLELGRKGILFALMLLSLELTLFGAYALLLHQSSEENGRNAHAQFLITESNELMRLFYDVTLSVLTLTANKSDTFLEMYKQRCIAIPVQMELVRTIAMLDPLECKIFAAIEYSSGKALRVLQRNARLIEEGNRSLTLVGGYELQQETAQVSDEVMAKLHSFVVRERKLVEASAKRALFLQQQLQWLSYIGLGGNAALGVALVSVLGRRGAVYRKSSSVDGV